MKNRVTLFKCVFGSRLYGTDTIDSDTDLKEVFVPSCEEILLGRTKIIEVSQTNHDGKNGSEDVDIERISIQRFLELLSQGQTGALDVLFAKTNKDIVIQEHPVWSEIYDKRSSLISSQCDASIGYMRSQVNRYAVRGDRLKSLTVAIDFFKDLPKKSLVGEYEYGLSNLVESLDYCDFWVNNSKQDKYFSCCNKKVSFSNTVDVAIEYYNKLYKEYGNRAKKAFELDGVDFKGVSHCIRIGEQLIELLKTGHVEFPRHNAARLKEIKSGVGMDYQGDIAPYIEMLFEDCLLASEVSNLPDNVSKTFIDDMVMGIHMGKLMGEI